MKLMKMGLIPTQNSTISIEKTEEKPKKIATVHMYAGPRCPKCHSFLSEEMYNDGSKTMKCPNQWCQRIPSPAFMGHGTWAGFIPP